MYCIACGSSIMEGSKFCGQCGKEVEEPLPREGKELPAEIETTPDLEDEEVEEQVQSTTESLATSIHQKSWFFPVSALVVVLIGLGSVYGYQSSINDKVEQTIQAAEKLALEGNLIEAKEQNHAALSIRKNHPILMDNQKIIEDALLIDQLIQEGQDLATGKKFNDGLAKVEQAKKTLKAREGAVYDLLTEKANGEAASITVAQVEAELASKNSIGELIPLLLKLDNYPEESNKIKANVLEKMVNLATTGATKALQSKDYLAAQQTIEEVLKYDEKNSKLLGMRETISEEKSNFEKAEQKRLEVAIEASIKQDIKNRTEAVELTYLDYGLDAYGSFYVIGEVKNVASRPIQSVLIYYEILDENGAFIKDGVSYVEPYYLDVEELGVFGNTHYDYYGEMKSVNMTRVEWRLG